MKTEIVRTGDTLTVEIPEELAAQVNLAAGDAVEWVSHGAGSLALVKSAGQAQKKPADLTLEELLEGLREGDSIGEYDWGPPRGVEPW